MVLGVVHVVVVLVFYYWYYYTLYILWTVGVVGTVYTTSDAKLIIFVVWCAVILFIVPNSANSNLSVCPSSLVMVCAT